MAPSTTRTVYRFGTSGYRNNTEEGFNEAVVTQIVHAMADYLIGEMEQTGKILPVLVGGDARIKTRRYLPLVAQLLQARGLDVFLAEAPLTSPALAYAAKYFSKLGVSDRYTQSAGAVLLTASHNPWDYGGINYLTPDAALMPLHISQQVEQYQQAPAHRHLNRAQFGLPNEATIQAIDPYEIYKNHFAQGVNIDFEIIRASGLKVFYDPLFGVGGRYFPRLLQEKGIPEVTINDGPPPEGYTGYPEPSRENLQALGELIQQDQTPLKVGFSNDGDADRFGVLDENGTFVKADDVLAVLLYHLTQNRKQCGVVLRSHSTSHLLDELATQAGLEVIPTPVGYKYTAEVIIEREQAGETPVLLGGESSAGLSIRGHIPEKDGILANLLVAELVATEGVPLSKILEKVKINAQYRYCNSEVGIKTNTNEQKTAILEAFQQLVRQSGQNEIVAGLRIDTERSTAAANALIQHYGLQDGAKLFLENGHWLLLRASGTEPLLRAYVETVGSTDAEAQAMNNAILDWLKERLVNQHDVLGSNITLKN